MLPRILCDCDGVLADFNGYCINLINRNYGTNWSAEDNTEWEFTNLVPTQDQLGWATDPHAHFRRMLTLPGVCSSLQPFPGARQFVESLQQLGSVYVVTSPLSGSRTWMAERYDWLQEHVGVDKDHVIFASDKSPVDGIVLIDDKASNLVEWEAGARRPGDRVGVLLERPYSGKWDGARASTLDGVLREVRYYL